MFTFAPDDKLYHPQPVPPALALLALREALTAVQLRIVFVGHPREPRFADGGVDWSRELGLITGALTLSCGHDWPNAVVWAAPTVVVHTQKGASG